MADHSSEPGRTRSEPSAAEIRAELERVLATRAFEQAGRASQFLRYVVEETLAGRGERLKGYAIGVAVFEKAPDFDPQADPAVRVEAGRLRRRLKEQYLAEGADSSLRIELPRGGYVPEFHYAQPQIPARAAEAAPSLEAHGRSAQRSFLYAVLGLAALVVLAWYIAGLREPGQPDVARVDVTESLAALEPRLLVMPFVDLSGDPDIEHFSQGLTDEIIRALIAFDVVGVASPIGPGEKSASLADLRATFKVGYVLAGNIRHTADGVRVAVRVMDAETGTQLWAKVFEEPDEVAEQLATQERLANSLAAIVASSFGPVNRHEMEKIDGKPDTELNAYECVLRFYAYTYRYDVAGHASARACLERAVVVRPGYQQAWSALAALYLQEHLFGYNIRPDDPPALDRALEAARKALDIDGDDRLAGLVLLAVRRAQGDTDGLEHAAVRLLMMKPPHPAVLAQMAYSLTLAGDWQRGAHLFEAALPLAGEMPRPMYATPAFRYLQTGEYRRALDAALDIDAPEWFVTPMLSAAAAALADRPDIAAREAARLRELYPDFERVGAEQLHRWSMAPALEDAILEGLGRAGLAMQSPL